MSASDMASRLGTPRNRIQETAFSVHFVLGMRVFAVDFAAYDEGGDRSDELGEVDEERDSHLVWVEG